MRLSLSYCFVLDAQNAMYVFSICFTSKRSVSKSTFFNVHFWVGIYLHSCDNVRHVEFGREMSPRKLARDVDVVSTGHERPQKPIECFHMTSRQPNNQMAAMSVYQTSPVGV